MDQFVTVRTFTNPIDLAVIKGRLESEGIECVVQDELTSRANAFYSAAMGGARLQVRQSDLKATIEMLEEGGYLKEADFLPTPFYTTLDNVTFKIPFLRGMRMEFRLMVIVAAVVSLLLLLMFFINN